MSKYSDIEYMIGEMIDGDDEAWSFFLKKYGKLIYCCINKIVLKCNRSILQEDREDCFQEVLRILLEADCRRLKSILSFEEKSFRSYLGMASTRIAMNFFFRGKIPIPMSDDILGQIPDSSSDLDRGALRGKIMDIIAQKLPSREALVISYFLDGLTLHQIAELMEIGPTTVFKIKERAISIITSYCGMKEGNGEGMSYSYKNHVKGEKKQIDVSND